MIAHESFDTGVAGNPQGIGGLPPSFIFGVATDFLDVGANITVGSASGSPWIGFGGDRGDRVFGVTPSTTEQTVTIAGNAQLVSLHNALLLNGQLNSMPGASFTKRGGGIVIINNVNNGYTGNVTVQEGSLLIDGNLPGAVMTVVQSGASLGGKGTLGGSVSVQDGGHLTPGSVQSGFQASTFTINGGLTLSPSAVLDFDLGAAGSGVGSDMLIVNGSLSLDGILNVNGLPDFSPGMFTLFQTTGPINDMGLTLGFVPDGFTLNFSIVQPSGGNPGTVMVNAVPLPPGVMWAGTGTGNWSNPLNWNPNNVPNSPDAIANFGSGAGVTHVVNLDAPQTIGTLNLDSVNPYTINGGSASNTLTLSVTGGHAAINVISAGNHIINAPVVLASDTTISVPTGNVLSVKSLRGAGLTLNTGGTTRILPDGTATGHSTVTSLTIAGGMTPTATLDVTNNAVVVDYSASDPTPFQTIRADPGGVQRPSGHWTGKGITSSMANDTSFGIGYAERSSLGGVASIFGTVDAQAVLVRLTRYGDADLNGVVNLLDFNRLAANFNQSGKFWSDGDFNYDGNVNLLDFNRLAANFNLSATGIDGPTPQDWANLAAAVPEPTSVTVLAISMALTGSCTGPVPTSSLSHHLTRRECFFWAGGARPRPHAFAVTAHRAATLRSAAVA